METTQASLGRSKKLRLAGRDIMIRELNVRESREWLKGLEGRKESDIDLISEGLVEEASLSEISMMTDIALEDMDEMLPSDLTEIARQCKAMNAHFFSLRNRLLTATQLIAEKGEKVAGTTNVV